MVYKSEYLRVYDNPLVRLYKNKVFNTYYYWGELYKIEPILDFGCGRKYLKLLLGAHRVFSYDILEELNEVSDYTKLKPKVIVCNNVLEYIPPEELKGILNHFFDMKPLFILVGLPTETWYSRLLQKITKSEVHYKSRETYPHVVERLLSKRFIKLTEKNVLGMTKISKWMYKPSAPPKILHLHGPTTKKARGR